MDSGKKEIIKCGIGYVRFNLAYGFEAAVFYSDYDLTEQVIFVEPSFDIHPAVILYSCGIILQNSWL